MPIDVAIVGAGPAGSAAAVQCRRLGLSVALMDGAGRAGGLIENAWSIENDPATGGPIGGPEYATRLRTALARFGVEVVPWEVKSVTGNFVLEGEMAPLAAKAVVLATGTRPLPAGIPGELEVAGNALYYEVAPALAVRPTSALVIGGGEAAFDYALSLAGGGAQVTIAIRASNHQANDRLAAAVEASPAITVTTQMLVQLLAPTRGGCSASGSGPQGSFELTVDVVVVAVGRRPRLPDLGELLERGPGPRGAPTGRRGIAAGRAAASGKTIAAQGLTILPGLYIAGDARLGSLGQSGIAVGDGLEAAQLAAAHVAELREKG